MMLLVLTINNILFALKKLNISIIAIKYFTLSNRGHCEVSNCSTTVDGFRRKLSECWTSCRHSVLNYLLSIYSLQIEMQCLRNKKIIKNYENFGFKNHNTGKDSLHTATSTVPLFLFFFLCSIKIKIKMLTITYCSMIKLHTEVVYNLCSLLFDWMFNYFPTSWKKNQSSVWFFFSGTRLFYDNHRTLIYFCKDKGVSRYIWVANLYSNVYYARCRMSILYRYRLIVKPRHQCKMVCLFQYNHVLRCRSILFNFQGWQLMALQLKMLAII